MLLPAARADSNHRREVPKSGFEPMSVAVVYCMPSCHALGCFNYHSHTWPPTLHPRMCATNPPKSPSLHRRSVCAAKSSIVETCLAVCGAAIFLLENDSSGLSKAKIFSGAPPPTPRIQDPSPDARPRHPCHPSPPQGQRCTSAEALAHYHVRVSGLM